MGACKANLQQLFHHHVVSPLTVQSHNYSSCPKAVGHRMTASVVTS